MDFADSGLFLGDKPLSASVGLLLSTFGLYAISGKLSWADKQ